MATITYDNVTYTVKYVNPLASSAGSGATVDTALINLPSTLVDYTCYLIRRTTDEQNLGVDLQRTRNSGKTHIMFLGMPDETSALYSQIEQDAKTAWGSDTAKYARIRCNTPTHSTAVADCAIFYENSIKTLYCENCYFFRDANGATASSYLWPIFHIDSDNTADRNLIWNKCKFSYTQYDLENDDWLASNQNITTNNYSEVKCSSYVNVNSAHLILFKDCVINYVGQWDNRWTYAERQYSWNRCITIWNGAKHTEFDGCQINYLNYRNWNREVNNYPYNQCICVEHSRQNYTTKAVFRNLELNWIMCINATTAYAPNIINCQAADVTVENVKCDIKHMKNYTTSNYSFTSSADYNYGFMWLRDVRNTLHIDGYYLNMENRTDIKISGLPTLTLTAMPVAQAGNPGSCVKNIDIRFPSSVHRTVGGNILYCDRSTYGYRTDNSYDYIRFDDSARNYNITFLNNYIMRDIYVSAPAHGEWGVHINRIGLKTDTLNCKVFASSCAVQINKLINNRSESRGFRGDYSTYLKCGTYTVNLDRYTGVRQIDLDGRSAAYITSSNCVPYNENCISTGDQSAATSDWICLNTIESGQFFARNPMVFAKSWSSIRTGSTALASLKLYANVYNDPIYPLCIGAYPYKGFEVTPATIGKKLLTMYFARGLFGGNELEKACSKLWIEVRVPEIQEDESIRYYSRDSLGQDFIADSSTWSGTTAVTPFKIELPIEVKELTVPVEVKLYYKWYSSGGFVYADPDIRLTDISS